MAAHFWDSALWLWLLQSCPGRGQALESFGHGRVLFHLPCVRSRPTAPLRAPQDPCAHRKWADPKIFASNRPIPPHSDKSRSRHASTDASESPKGSSPISRVGRPRQSLLTKRCPSTFWPGKGLPRAPQGCPRPTGVLTPPPRPTQTRDTSRHDTSKAIQHNHAPRHERQARHAALKAHGQEAPGHEDAR